MEPHIINRQMEIVSSYIAYLENSYKYINVLDTSLLKKKIEDIRKVYSYASEPLQKEYLYVCNVSIGQLELNSSISSCRFVIEAILFDLYNHLNELKKSRSKVDRTIILTH